jgi:Fe-S cluster assembly ATP-binding protein
MLHIKDLTVTIDDKEILHHFSLKIEKGTVSALMGPNGSGKSTLANVIAGHPSYQVLTGEIWWNGIDIVTLAPEERASHGVFLALQYPPSLPGVAVSHFLRMALNAQEKSRGEAETKLTPFLTNLKAAMKTLEIPWAFAGRSVNDGFSGGEKKRLEILQMLILRPSLILLDEIDSGLDIDAIKLVAHAISSLCSPEHTIVAITHYQRLLNYLTPDTVHVMKEGNLIKSGDASLALALEHGGYAEI